MTKNHKKHRFDMLKEINKSLDPQFQLSKIELEDIHNSKTIKVGDWNTNVSPSLMI